MKRNTMTILLDDETREAMNLALDKAIKGMKKNETYLKILRKGLGIKEEVKK